MTQLQNIPSRSKPDEYDERIQKLGPSIREMFAAPPPDEFSPEGYDLIITDLSQLELRLGAHFTKDPTLVKVYQESVEMDGITYYTGDPHAETAKRMKVPRKLAKNLNFGLMYGMSAPKFAKYAKIYLPGTKQYDINTAAAYVTAFQYTYSGVFQYHDKLRSRWLEKQRSFEMLSGRLRHFPADARVSPGTIYNSKIQGSAGDIIKTQLWAIAKFIMPRFPGFIPLIQVHDELLFQAPKRISKQVAVLKKAIMEFPWFQISVPILASTKICQTWADKDNDFVPEVGRLYARVQTDNGEEDRTYIADNWKEYATFDKAKKVVKKSAVAMLNSRQREWAEGFLPPEVSKHMFSRQRSVERLLTLEEYRAKREAQKEEEQ